MAKQRKPAGARIAELDLEALGLGPLPAPTPEEALGFPEPEDEEIGVVGTLPRQVPVPVEPAQIDVAPPVQPNGVPTSLVEAAKTPQDRILEMLNDPRRKALIDEITKQSRGDIDLQRQGIEANERDLAKMQARGPQVNVAPLTALVDSWTGSKFSQNYQQPETPDERAQKIMVLKNALQQQKQGLSASQIQLLKSLYDESLPLQLLKNQGTQERSDRKYNQSIDDNIKKEYSVATKDLEDLGTKYKGLEEALKSGNQVRINSSLSNFARLIAGEKGVLTDQDIGRAMPPTLTARINNLSTYFGENSPPPPQNVVREMLSLVAQAKQYLREGYLYKLDKTQETLNALPTYRGAEGVGNLYEINKNNILRNLPDTTQVKSKPKSAPKPKSDTKQIEDEIKKLEAELGVSQ